MIFPRHNDALNVNPPSGNIHLTKSGSDWLWAVVAVYTISLLVLVVLAYFARAGEKIFHYLFTISLFVGAISYFAIASDLGSTAVKTSDRHAGDRQIFFARYINWFVGWTPVVLAVGLASGLSWATILYNIVLVWIWITSWLAGALTGTKYKWGFFVFGLFAEILLWVSLLHWGSVTAKRIGIAKHYWGISGWLSLLWLLYPIAWGVDDGGNVISVTKGFIFFGILDILLVPSLAFSFLALSTRWDYRALNLYFTQYGRVAQAGGEFPEGEKGVGAAPPGGPVAPAASTTTPAPGTETV